MMPDLLPDLLRRPRHSREAGATRLALGACCPTRTSHARQLAVLLLWALPLASLAGSAAWETMASMPIGVQEIYPAVHQGRIVVAGGVSSQLPASQGHMTAAVQVYDPLDGRWTLGPSLPEPRHHAQLVSHGGSLWVLGGFVRGAGGDWHARRDILRLDAKVGRWQRVGEMPRPLTETVVWSDGHRLHLASGRSPKGQDNRHWGDHDDVAWHWILEPGPMRWTEAPPLPLAFSSAAIAQDADGQAWVIGGRRHDGANTVAVWLASPAWRAGPALPQAQAAHGAAWVPGPGGPGSLWTAGGEFAEQDRSGVLGQVFRLDLASGTWQRGPELPTPRHGLGLVALNGYIYALGGARAPGLELSTDRVERLRVR